MSENDRKVLEALCRKTRLSARAAGKPVLASFAFEREATDLLQFAGGAAGVNGFGFYWEHPRDGFALVAGGVAQRLCAKGRGRFRQMAEKVEPLLRSAITAGCANSGPYALGGFSFFDDLDETQWPGFGAAQMVVPEWMLLRRGAGMTAMVNTMIAPDCEPRSVAAEMAEKARALKGGPGAVAGGQNGSAPIVEDMESVAPGAAAAKASAEAARGEEGHGRWLEMVARAVAEIRAGQLSKVVLARTFDVVCRAARFPLPILARLRQANPDCFNFMINPGEGQVFLGATPEQLARFSNGAVELGALAGTSPRGENAKEDEAFARRMLESRKDRCEHQIVVDTIVKNVEGLGEIQRPGEPCVVKLSNLQHLYTPITLHSKAPISVISMIERLHPTPAVGGHPGPAALERIRKFENFERGWYAGPLGWMNAQGEGEFAVALRACTLSADRARLYAGGGIVADSDPEQEYLETQLKLKPILAAIADE